MKKLFGLLAVIALFVVGGLIFTNRDRSEAYAADCDANAIIRCGVSDQSALKSAYKSDTTKDLPAIFNHYKITSTMINGATAKQGTVYKNGDVKIGSELVATGAQSVGRHNMAGSTAISITKGDGTKETIYQRKTSTSFVADSIPALVFVDGNGKFIAAVLKSCGNPVVATPKPKPIYVCKALVIGDVPADRNKFTMKATTTLSDVTFKYITYTVKLNGKVEGAPIKATNQNPVTYTVTKAGAYDIEATVTVESQGRTLTSPVGGCTDGFDFVFPEYKCTALAVTAGSDRTKFSFKPTVAVKNGATFKSVVYTVKDNAGKTVFTSPAVGAGAYTYTQATEGAYTVTAATTFDVAGKSVTVNQPACAGKFTVTPAPQTPVFVCQSLTVEQNGDRTNFLFTPKANIGGGATFKSATYTVKDGTGKVVSTIPANSLDAVRYTQNTEGKYTVELVIDVTVGGQTKRATGTCNGQFEVKPAPATPTFACTKFTSTPVANQKMTYQFSIVYTAEGGATLTKTVVNYGEGADVEIPAAQLTNFTHKFTTEGAKNVVATLSFKTSATATDVQTVTCSTKLDISVEKCTLPGHTTEPADSPTCKPCEYDSSLAADSPNCKKPVVLTATTTTPTQLVNTGPGDVIGLFASITVAGAIAHRFVWMRRYYN